MEELTFERSIKKKNQNTYSLERAFKGKSHHFVREYKRTKYYTVSKTGTSFLTFFHIGTDFVKNR